MMKSYCLYVFTQDNCPPCTRLKDFVSTLPEADQRALHFVPMKTASGARTALAEELQVELTPTLVVTYEGEQCRIDEDGFEDCDYTEEPVERYIGANSIIEHLDNCIEAYTYAHPPIE
jgi:hypothetical protein